MELRREQVKRSFCGFDKAPVETGVTSYTKHIDKNDLIALINYMSRFGFRLGPDFHFVMGSDAPDDKRFFMAVESRSLMCWKEKPDNDYEEIDEKGFAHREQFIAVCIETMKADLAKEDHLEVWDDAS